MLPNDVLLLLTMYRGLDATPSWVQKAWSNSDVVKPCRAMDTTNFGRCKVPTKIIRRNVTNVDAAVLNIQGIKLSTERQD
jgi:hypothetical protein